MPTVRAWLQRLDRFQRRRPVLAVGFGVVKKFGDDGAGRLAALMTYYGFVSLFPLLLVMVTVLGYVLSGNPDLQRRILDTTFAQFPIIGDQLRANVHSVQGNGFALVLGLLGALYGGLGIANVSQHAMNRIWGVPVHERPGFVPRIVRSLGVLATIGVGILVTTAVSGFSAGASMDAGPRIAALVIVLLANFALFLWAYQLLVARRLPWRDLIAGAIVASVGWELLQALGGLYVSHVLQGASQVYGLFALVFGLFAWISLLAQVVLYAAELNAVRAGRLWPRALAPPPYTEADDRAFASYAQMQARRPGETIEVETSP